MLVESAAGVLAQESSHQSCLLQLVVAKLLFDCFASVSFLFGSSFGPVFPPGKVADLPLLTPQLSSMLSVPA